MQHRESSSSKGTWPILGTAVAGVVLFGALATVVKPPATAPAPAPFLLSGPHVLRCPSCGWIEAKRELAPLVGDAHALRIYEYTLRMQDGSMSLFQETLPTSWRVGERIMLIEAAGALD
jgi:hypothetical protein